MRNNGFVGIVIGVIVSVIVVTAVAIPILDGLQLGSETENTSSLGIYYSHYDGDVPDTTISYNGTLWEINGAEINPQNPEHVIMTDMFAVSTGGAPRIPPGDVPVPRPGAAGVFRPRGAGRLFLTCL